MIGPKVASHFSRAASSSLHSSQSTLRNVWHSNNSGLGWNDRFFDSNGYSYRSNRSSSTFSHTGRAVAQANAGQHSLDPDDAEFELDQHPTDSPLPSVSSTSSLQPTSRPRSRSTKDISISKVLQKRCNAIFGGQTASNSELVPPTSLLTGSPESSIPTSGELNVDPTAPQSVSPPLPPSEPPKRSRKANAGTFASGTTFPSSAAAAEAVRTFLETSKNSTTSDFNAALRALVATRQTGENLALILETYNTMLERSLDPTVETYITLLKALLERDHETTLLLDARSAKAHTAHLSSAKQSAERDAELATLKAENSFQSAFDIFLAVVKTGKSHELPIWVFESLMKSCAREGHADKLKHITLEFEERGFQATPEMYRYMIQTLAHRGLTDTVDKVFDQFSDVAEYGKLNLINSTLSKPLGEAQARYAIMQVYNQTIEAYFRLGAPEKAIELLGRMMASKAPRHFPVRAVPPPSCSTYTCVISGFIQSGDIRSAEKWFSKLLEQSFTPLHPLEACEQIPRPDYVAWTVMLDALASAALHESAGVVPLPWATERFFHYSTLLFSDLIVGRDIVSLKLSDVSLYVKVVTDRVTRWKEHFLAQSQLASSGEAEVQKILTMLGELTGRSYYSKKLPSEPRTASSSLRFAIETIAAVSSHLANVAPSSPILPDLGAFAVNVFGTFLAREARRPLSGSAKYLEPTAKDAVRFLLQEIGQYLQMKDFFALASLVDRADLRDTYFEQIIASLALLRYQKSEEFEQGASWNQHQLLRLLTWAVADRKHALLRQSQTISSPSLDSVADTASESPTPSLSSFEGSEVTEETSPEIMTAVEATSLSPSPVSAILGHIISAGYTTLDPLPDNIQKTVISCVRGELGGDADNLLSQLGLVPKQPPAPLDMDAKVASGASLQSAEDFGRTPNASTLNPSAQAFVPNHTLESFPTSPSMAQADEHGNDALLPLTVPTDISVNQKDVSTHVQLLLDKHFKNPHSQHLQNAYNHIVRTFDMGRLPRFETLGSLIDGLGRLSKTTEIRVLYTIAQHALRRAMIDDQLRASGWFCIENAMVIAHAYSNNLDAAHVHRMRLLAKGYAPSSDAYAALVLKVKDTTDDTSNAMALFSEAKSHGVIPTIYLYNNIISKLSKARKADLVIEMFHEMRAQHIRPTSVTYGAVIGACVRVGDAQSAEVLFQEMTQAPNFRPRVPPYNNMMQLYTSIKPDRERALMYFEEMKKARITPTEHTYKLLLDAYGHCEPADPAGMDHVFEELLQLASRGALKLQGLHFNSLITAYGIKMGNLDRAREFFLSAPRLLNGQRDAVIYEAMFDVLRNKGLTEEVQGYIEMMNAEGCHMTAYICNVLIGAYSNAGMIERARELFQSMQDPPSGLAATGNHAPHDSTTTPAMSLMEPVYREPSTWEAMIQAEAKAGNLDGCYHLLARMEERRYPSQVYVKLQNLVAQYAPEQSST